MEIPIIFPQQSEEPRSLKVLKKIGDSKLSVYHSYCPSQRSHYALKVFAKDTFGTTQYKKEMLMSTLSHENIVKYVPASIEYNQDDFYTILTEFAQFGELFDLVVKGALNSEIIIRTYFHQLISGIEYVHSQGIAHLDLKLENLMLGEDFTLKIIDFDQAQRVTDKRVTSGGTREYRALEIIDGSCRNLKAADIYSIGVILYTLKAQEYPFVELTSGSGNNQLTTLKNYSTFTRDNKKYWAMKASKHQDGMFFSEDFKKLVNGMLECEPEKRFTLQDIKESRWYNGPVLDGEKLKEKMEGIWEKYMKSECSKMSVETE